VSISAGSGLIDFYLHPPIGLLEPQLDYYGPYSGNVTVSTWSPTPGPIFTPTFVSASYGVSVQLSGSIPIHWGRELGWVSDDGQSDETVFRPALGQLVVQHRFPTGAWVTTQMQVITNPGSVILWAVSLPGRLGLLVAPGLEFDLLFLVTI
jgi:hypothetical protein